MFETFENTNESVGLAKDASWQQGISNFDSGGRSLEKPAVLPWASASGASYMYYDVMIECYLDSGIVVHRHLPQSNPKSDSLGGVDMFQSDIDEIKDSGVHLKSNDDFEDVEQRMAHSIYRFCLRGEAIRVGYQVPIPKLLTVCGVKAIPDDSSYQKAYNKLVPANYSGVPMFYAAWELWYTVVKPPKKDQLPPPNLAEHIRADTPLPDNMQSPWTLPDQNAQTSRPPQLGNFIQG